MAENNFRQNFPFKIHLITLETRLLYKLSPPASSSYRTIHRPARAAASPKHQRRKMLAIQTQLQTCNNKSSENLEHQLSFTFFSSPKRLGRIWSPLSLIFNGYRVRSCNFLFWMPLRHMEWSYMSIHSSPRHQMKFSNKLHAPAALNPGKETAASIKQEAGWAPQTFCATNTPYFKTI